MYYLILVILTTSNTKFSLSKTSPTGDSESCRERKVTDCACMLLSGHSSVLRTMALTFGRVTKILQRWRPKSAPFSTVCSFSETQTRLGYLWVLSELAD